MCRFRREVLDDLHTARAGTDDAGASVRDAVAHVEGAFGARVEVEVAGGDEVAEVLEREVGHGEGLGERRVGGGVAVGVEEEGSAPHERLLEIQEHELHAEEATVRAEVREFLTNWLYGHVLVDDFAYRGCFNSQRDVVDEAIAAASAG